ncbi:rhomboid family intramembrane serine protease [Mucilaginibacter sp. UR6-11]|uniref:rhomboid family intramembrane serine protease n=1 Tax=Mucilaginibacter sp. UR6-11 TaxID=1435644 RepID=UPI001E3E9FAF|nr:rhomboid family intramembrane serine protease [Mucilaginibacter sp. UR6-11]
MFHSGSKLYLLIGINVFIFLVISALSIFEKLVFRTNIVDVYSYDYLSLPAYLPKLAVRFWTPFTYMFMHADFWHLLFNMLWLYWMGQIFEEFLGNKRILGLYLLGGLAGALLFVASYNIFPAFSQSGVLLLSAVVGGSASVMAIIAGAATITPNYTIMLFGIVPVKLKWIALFYVAMGFWGINGPNAGGEIAHLGGALFGFIYVRQLQKGRDMIGAIAGIFKKRSKLKVASNNMDRSAPGTPRQEEIDRILDKISTTGYDNLSKQEKETLFRASKK